MRRAAFRWGSPLSLVAFLSLMVMVTSLAEFSPDGEPGQLARSEPLVLGVQNRLGALFWAPDPLPASGEVLDLCVDEEAILAGLDGGDLETDRAAIGLDCAAIGSVISRFAMVLPTGGVMILSSGSGLTPDIGCIVCQLGPVEAPYDVAPTWIALGSLGASLDPAIEETPGLAVLPESLSLEANTVRGLVVNRSSEFARSAHVTVTGPQGVLGSGVIGLTIQSGEMAPFEIGLLQPAVLADLNFTVEAQFSTIPDLARSLLVWDMPGGWMGPTEDFPGIPTLATGLQPGAVVRYYETQIETVVPVSHPEAQGELEQSGILQPQALVAYLGPGGEVVDVEAVTIFQDSEGSVVPTHLPLGGLASLGFLLPDGAEDFALWVTGS